MNLLQRRQRKKQRTLVLLGALALLALTTVLWRDRPAQEALDRDATSPTTSEQSAQEGAPRVPMTAPLAAEPPAAQPRNTGQGPMEALPEGLVAPAPPADSISPAKSPEPSVSVLARDRPKRRIRPKQPREDPRRPEANKRATAARRLETTSVGDAPTPTPRRLSEHWDEELGTDAPPAVAPRVPSENSAGELSLDDM